MKIVCRKIRSVFCLLSLVASAAPALADVKLSSVFGDHMVLQQNASVPIWGTASPGEKISIALGDASETVTASPDGKWMVRFKDLKPGATLTMTVHGKNKLEVHDILVGEVWLASGQSNMEMMLGHDNWERQPWGVIGEDAEIAAANWPQIRIYTVKRWMTNSPQSELQGGEWQVVTPQVAPTLSAVGYFFARELHKDLKVPVGILLSSYGGSAAEAWIQRDALESKPDLHFILDQFEKARTDFKTNDAGRLKFAAALEKWLATTNQAMLDGKKLPRRPVDPDPEQNNHNPCVLFNAMIAPLVPYAVHGVIWYQGESNGPTARHYRDIMALLIGNWRQLWGEGDIAFITTQIAGWGAQSIDPTTDHPTAIIRDEQRRLLNVVTNIGMAVTIDIGDPANIHPKNKQEVGRRLALIAKAKVYGETNEYSGPLYDSMNVEDNVIRLHFTHSESGLTAAGGNLVGFTIAGEDKKFYWADAKINSDMVLVSSPEVPHPVAVRYSWGAHPMWSLFNRAGLPASPFRTDNW